MSIIDSLERRFGKYAIHNLTYYLIIGQVFAYILIYFVPHYETLFFLQGNLLLRGELWRLITFIFMPISKDLLFVAFTWYIFYIYGISLEQQWGSFRYLVYFLAGYIATIILTLLFPSFPLYNGYIYTSLFLAFAYMYPNYLLYIFFVIPVRVKWLALFTWIGLIVGFVSGPTSTKIITVVSISNFFLFFGKHVFYSLQWRLQGTSYQFSRAVESRKPHHICAVCGKNEIKNPDMDIRYCENCTPVTCYCGDHIRNHKHKSLPN